MNPRTNHARKIASLATVFIMVATFAALLGIPPVHASSAVINSATASFSVVHSTTISVTVANPGDTIALNSQISDGSTVGVSGIQINSVTDGLGSLYYNAFGQSLNAGKDCNSGTCLNDQIWAATTIASGSDLITVTFSTSAITGNLEALDVVGVSSAIETPALSQDCGFSTCGTVYNTAPMFYQAGDFLDNSVWTNCQAAHSFTAGVGFTPLGPASIFNGLVQYSSSGVLNPTNFPSSCTGGTSSWISVGVAFKTNSGAPVTTTVNTNCLGGCSGGNNGSSIYLPPPQSTFFNLHFYSSQNVQSPTGFSGQITNVTIKVAAVHITTATGILYICAWSTTGVPSGGNPYQLLACTSVILTNGTSNFFVHVNPQINIPSQAYYAVGVMTTTFASRGSGASQSGVAIYQTSQVGLTEYKYAVGSATPPNNFFSSTLQTPHDFIFVQLTFPVNLLTTTSTLTVTQSGIVTSTTTTVSTSTLVINQGDPTKPTFWYLPMFFILFFTAIFLGAYAMVNAATRGRLR